MLANCGRKRALISDADKEFTPSGTSLPPGLLRRLGSEVRLAGGVALFMHRGGQSGP